MQLNYLHKYITDLHTACPWLIRMAYTNRMSYKRPKITLTEALVADFLRVTATWLSLVCGLILFNSKVDLFPFIHHCIQNGLTFGNQKGDRNTEVHSFQELADVNSTEVKLSFSSQQNCAMDLLPHKQFMLSYHFCGTALNR